MPRTTPDLDDRTSALRSALLATVGLALWLSSGLLLVGGLWVSDASPEDLDRWTFAFPWVVDSCGAALLLVGLHRLAHGIQVALHRRGTGTAPSVRRPARRDPVAVLLAVGWALGTFAGSRVLVPEGGYPLLGVYDVGVIVATCTAPVVLTVGAYLALRGLAVLVPPRPDETQGDRADDDRAHDHRAHDDRTQDDRAAEPTPSGS